MLHPNIRSINKKFESLKQFYLSLNFDFAIVCFSETWDNDTNINKNSLFQLPNYNTELQIQILGKEEEYVSVAMNHLIIRYENIFL